MTRVDEFDSFFRAGFDGVLQVTYALCGDRQVALEATTDAFRRAWRDWAKIRDRAPLAYVRTEAWKATSLNRSTHPLRRRHEDDSDVELLDDLADLSVEQRRLLILMTLGNTDLEEASREVGLPAEAGIEQATDALGRLERATGQGIEQIEDRLHGLSAATAGLSVPSPGAVRTAARRGTQRNTVLLVALALVATIGAGFAATDGAPLDRQTALPQREKLGAEGSDIVLDSRRLSDQNLLTAQQVSQLDPTATWTVEGTDEDPDNTTPYATCPTQRFADPDPLRVFVRTFSSSTKNGRVAQSIEVSRSPAEAAKAAKTLISWFADCTHPRVQLLNASTVKRPFGDFTILRLRSNRSPERTFTVGFASSGAITTTVVHEVDGDQGPSPEVFARVLNDSVAKVCAESGGRCSDDDILVVKGDPPPTSEAPEFLGIVDLPPIADVNRVWAAVAARPDPNPAATPCDAADFTAKNVSEAASRIFVLYQATELPREFGLTETIGKFSSDDAAKTFVDKVSKKIDDCSDVNLSAKIDQSVPISNGPTTGATWRVSVEADKGVMVRYRVGLVRRGAFVAQVTLVTAGRYDVSKSVFAGLTTRAGTRLQYAE